MSIPPQDPPIPRTIGTAIADRPPQEPMTLATAHRVIEAQGLMLKELRLQLLQCEREQEKLWAILRSTTIPKDP